MSKNELRNRLVRNSKIETTAVLSESTVFSDSDVVVTPVPAVNIALSGSPNGGLLPGVLMIAGNSKHFKTAFGLLMVSSFLKKHEDGIVIFYDSEFGTNDSYYKMFDIDKNKIVHCPIMNVEEFKQDIANQLKNITKEDNVMIFVDSIGNLASLKEVTDAEDGKTVADMTRAKQLKSTFRIIAPHLTMKKVPMVVINHVYKEIGLYPKDIVSGGTGSYYSANDIWIIGRRQDKDNDGLHGYNFIINVEKSRTVKEKSQIPISVTFDAGINKFSGLFDMAVDVGIMTSPSKGRYECNGRKGFRKEFETDLQFLLDDPVFVDAVLKKYKLGA